MRGAAQPPAQFDKSPSHSQPDDPVLTGRVVEREINAIRLTADRQVLV